MDLDLRISRSCRVQISSPARSQTLGGLLEFNPHCHILLADGGFYVKDMFRVAPRP